MGFYQDKKFGNCSCSHRFQTGIKFEVKVFKTLSALKKMKFDVNFDINGQHLFFVVSENKPISTPV